MPIPITADLLAILRSKGGRNNLGRITVRWRGGGHKRSASGAEAEVVGLLLGERGGWGPGRGGRDAESASGAVAAAALDEQQQQRRRRSGTVGAEAWEGGWGDEEEWARAPTPRTLPTPALALLFLKLFLFTSELACRTPRIGSLPSGERVATSASGDGTGATVAGDAAAAAAGGGRAAAFLVWTPRRSTRGGPPVHHATGVAQSGATDVCVSPSACMTGAVWARGPVGTLARRVTQLRPPRHPL